MRHLFSSPLLFVLDGQPRRRSRRGPGDVVRSTMFRDRSPGFVDRPIVRSLAGSPRVRCCFCFVSLAKPSRRHCVRSAWESAQSTAQLLPFTLLLSVDAGPPPYCFVRYFGKCCVCVPAWECADTVGPPLEPGFVTRGVARASVTFSPSVLSLVGLEVVRPPSLFIFWFVDIRERGVTLSRDWAYVDAF